MLSPAMMLPVFTLEGKMCQDFGSIKSAPEAPSHDLTSPRRRRPDVLHAQFYLPLMFAFR